MAGGPATAGGGRGAGPGAASTASPSSPPPLLPGGGAAPVRRGPGGGGSPGGPARPDLRAGQRGARPRARRARGRAPRCEARSALLLLGVVVAGWCALGSRPLVGGAPAVPTFQCPLDGQPVVRLEDLQQTRQALAACQALDAGPSDADPVLCMQGNGTSNCTECQRTYCEITAEYLDYRDWQMLMTGVPNTNVPNYPGVERYSDVFSSYMFFNDTDRTAPGAGSSNSSSNPFLSVAMSRASRAVLPDVNYTASTPATEYVADCMRSLENTTLTGPTAPEVVGVVRGKDGICVEFNEPGVLNGSSTLGHNVSGGAVRWGTAS